MNSGAMSATNRLSEGHGMPSNARRGLSSPIRMGNARMPCANNWSKNDRGFPFGRIRRIIGNVTRNLFHVPNITSEKTRPGRLNEPISMFAHISHGDIGRPCVFLKMRPYMIRSLACILNIIIIRIFLIKKHSIINGFSPLPFF